MITSARYNRFSDIEAVIDGRTVFVADDMSNATRREIAAWVAEGGVIAAFVEPPVSVPDSVSARQFKLQLLAAGLIDQVEAFIASQGPAVQIAFDNSGSFVRTEPMMAAGFAALGFSEAEVDAFFAAAAKL